MSEMLALLSEPVSPEPFPACELKFARFSLNDVILLPFLTAPTERAAQQQLNALICHTITPQIARTLRQRCHSGRNRRTARYQTQEEQEAEDLSQDALMSTITQLQSLRNGTQTPIANFVAYVNTTTGHVCAERNRRRQPMRQQCKNRLRYFFRKQSELALWQNEKNRTLCGLAAWKDRSPEIQALELPLVLPDTLQTYLSDEAQGEAAPSADWLLRLLTWWGSPLSLENLTTLVMREFGIQEPVPFIPPALFAGYGEDFDPDNSRDTASSVADCVEQRDFLSHLWQEILQLPTCQRTALLLNLHDTQGDVLTLLTETGIAPLHEIARAVGLSEVRLTALWRELPLEDSELALRMGARRQQIINWRKAARARLHRRTDRFQ